MSTTDSLKPRNRTTIAIVAVSLIVAIVALTYSAPLLFDGNNGNYPHRDDGENALKPRLPEGDQTIPGPKAYQPLPKDWAREIPGDATPPADKSDGIVIEVRLVTDRAEFLQPEWTAYLVSSYSETDRTTVARTTGTGESTCRFVPKTGTYDIQLRAEGWIADDQFGIEFSGHNVALTVVLYQLAELRCSLVDVAGDAVADETATLYPPASLLSYHGLTANNDEVDSNHRRAEFPLVVNSDSRGGLVP